MQKKKRTIFSLILTIGLMYKTQSLWLLVPLPILKLDIELFIIIAVLSFLLFYKLSDYVANFKTIEQKSRLDIIFLTVFFIFLFIPMSHIDKSEKSIQENRTLETYEPLIKDNKINYNYGKNFETWFNDRFKGRLFLTKFYNAARILIAKRNNKGLKTAFKALIEFDKVCRENNIKLYILITPDRSMAHISTVKFNKKNKEYEKFFIKQVNKAINENNLKIIFPYQELREFAQNSYSFFKTDHHWTDDGAYIGYLTLMQEIKKDFPNVPILSSNDYSTFYSKRIRAEFSREFSDIGYTCRYIGVFDSLCKKYQNVEYKYYKHKDFNNLVVDVTENDLERTKLYSYNKGYPLKVVLLGTSVSDNLCEFLPFTFSKTIRMRLNGIKSLKNNKRYEFQIIKRYKERILNYNPDILVICLNYGQFQYLKYIFDERE